MIGHPWPGNVRELRNFLERLIALSGATPTLPMRDVSLAAPPDLDLHLKATWSAAVSGPTIARKPWPDWGRDFDGQPRTAGSIGAYGKIASTGWRLRIGSKDVAAATRAP